MSGLKGKLVVVTGADGFIGSHLVDRLVREGARVRALSLYNSQGTHGWLGDLSAEVRAEIDVRLGDIRDAEFVDALCASAEVIFHLAALISIPYSYVAAESYISTNISGTLNVLKAARRANVERLVHTSTSEVYGTPATLPIRESHAINAQSPYAATKVAADQLVLAFQKSFDVPAMVLRPFNTYGPRQSTRAVLSTVLVQLIAGRKELQLGRLDPRRDLTYVEDTVNGFCLAATAPSVIGETIQLGTGVSVSIEELVAVCQRVVGTDARVVQDERRLRPDASEVLVLQSDPALAKKALNWTASVPLEEGVRRTAAWIRDHAHLFDPAQLHL